MKQTADGEQTSGQTPYTEILRMIEDGDTDMAQMYYRLYFDRLTEEEASTLYGVFMDIFGYPIV